MSGLTPEATFAYYLAQNVKEKLRQVPHPIGQSIPTGNLCYLLNLLPFLPINITIIFLLVARIYIWNLHF